MKYLILILSLFLFSCQTVHKTITDNVKKVDSNSLSRKDTSSISLQSILSDSIAVHGLDITINYQDSNSTDIDSATLEELINHPLTGGNISSLHIHIDSVEHKKVVTTIKDSSSGTEVTKTAVKTSTEQYSKVVSKTGIPWWIYLVGGIVVLVIAFLFLKKIIKI